MTARGAAAPAAPPRSDVAGSLAAVVAACLFGMLGPLARLAGDQGLPGIGMTAWRALLGIAFLAVMLVVTRSAGESIAALRALPARGRASLATAAIAGLVLNGSIFTAFALAPVAPVLMMFYTYPAGVAVVDLLLGHERLTRARAVALGLSMGGVILVLAAGAPTGEAAPNLPLGIVLGLVSSAAQVLFVTASRSGYRSVPAAGATLVIIATAFVGATAIAVITGLGPRLLVPFSTLSIWPIILLAGVAGAGVSSSLFLTAIRRIGGTRTGILMLVEPAVGVVLAAVVLGESLAPLQVGGVVLVLLGALVLQRSSEPDLEPMVEASAGPVV